MKNTSNKDELDGFLKMIHFQYVAFQEFMKLCDGDKSMAYAMTSIHMEAIFKSVLSKNTEQPTTFSPNTLFKS